jgi:hypothetical protein
MGWFANPHWAHGIRRGAPHSLQNSRPSGFSKPQLGQRMDVISGTAAERLGRARVDASARASAMGIVDGVSILQTWPGVKRKAPDDLRGRSGLARWSHRRRWARHTGDGLL